MKVPTAIAFALLVCACSTNGDGPEREPVTADAGPLDETDMERLARTRRELVERSTPFGEEHDQTEELRKRLEQIER
jgi:hypothetical protein